MLKARSQRKTSRLHTNGVQNYYINILFVEIPSQQTSRLTSRSLDRPKPVFHRTEFCARSVIFHQNCAATELKAVQLFQSHGKCRSAHKIWPSGKRPLGQKSASKILNIWIGNRVIKNSTRKVILSF